MEAESLGTSLFNIVNNSAFSCGPLNGLYMYFKLTPTLKLINGYFPLPPQTLL